LFVDQPCDRVERVEQEVRVHLRAQSAELRPAGAQRQLLRNTLLLSLRIGQADVLEHHSEHFGEHVEKGDVLAEEPRLVQPGLEADVQHGAGYGGNRHDQSRSLSRLATPQRRSLTRCCRVPASIARNRPIDSPRCLSCPCLCLGVQNGCATVEDVPERLLPPRTQVALGGRALESREKVARCGNRRETAAEPGTVHPAGYHPQECGKGERGRQQC
jgi:hypothetical protein